MMRIVQLWRGLLALASLAALLVAGSPAQAELVTITVTNNEPAGGFSLTPFWFGVHDGTFTTFTPGGTTSPAWQSLAELGNTGPITAAFTGHGVQTTLVASTGAFLPGGSASTVLDVTNPGSLRYLSFGSMVVPSNDLFIGNGDPKAIQLFDATGKFVGPSTIQIFGANVWDAGTEVNNILDGAAFVKGEDATKGAREHGTAALFFSRSDAQSYLNSINGIQTAAGYNISHLFTSTELIATLAFTPTPEPSTFALAGLGGLGLIGYALRRRRT